MEAVEGNMVLLPYRVEARLPDFCTAEAGQGGRRVSLRRAGGWRDVKSACIQLYRKGACQMKGNAGTKKGVEGRLSQTLNDTVILSVVGHVGQERLGTGAEVMWTLLGYHDQIQ